jgi:hypothetical protein
MCALISLKYSGAMSNMLVKNVFWSVANSDPHAALSWDRMHAYNSGLFGRHLWTALQNDIIDLGRDAVKAADYQYVLNDIRVRFFLGLILLGWILFLDGEISIISRRL